MFIIAAVEARENKTPRLLDTAILRERDHLNNQARPTKAAMRGGAPPAEAALRTPRCTDHMATDQEQERGDPPPANDAARIATMFVIKLVVLTLLLGFGEAYIMQLSQSGEEPDWVFGLRELVAGTAAWLAGGFDARVELDSVTISAGAMHLIVSVECTALFAKALFCAAAIAYPARWRDRIVGFAIGIAGVTILNILRVAGLVLISLWLPRLFHFAHVVLMQWFLISCVAPLWLAWAAWTTKRTRKARG